MIWGWSALAVAVIMASIVSGSTWTASLTLLVVSMVIFGATLSLPRQSPAERGSRHE